MSWKQRIFYLVHSFNYNFTNPRTPLGRWTASKFTPENPDYSKRSQIEDNLSHQGNTQHCGDKLCGDPEEATLLKK